MVAICFAWPWIKEVLLKPLVDRMGSVLMAGLVGFGMTQPDAMKVTLGAIALVCVALRCRYSHC